jgi:hypothetical protein
MKITLRVQQNDGQEYEVTTNLFTVVAMERKFKIKASDLAQGIALEHLAFLAYESCKQSSITVPLSFDEYLKKLDSIDVVSEETANPSEEAVTQDN